MVTDSILCCIHSFQPHNPYICHYAHGTLQDLNYHALSLSHSLFFSPPVSLTISCSLSLSCSYTATACNNNYKHTFYNMVDMLKTLSLNMCALCSYDYDLNPNILRVKSIGNKFHYNFVNTDLSRKH